ncbi:MAG TPA: TetR/AcrR family transcriptional regulator [Candidatus Kapabacteria bacterium]|nr:TetR/AcrR family transcriptional regulator [Candidatus Kapabacteria bacterium]
MPSTSTIAKQETDLRTRIVDAARELFLEHGYSKVSASEIAGAIGISKKTLYREFATKEDILRAVVLPKLKESTKRIDAIIADRAIPFPEKLQLVLNIMGTQQQRVTPVFIRDISVHAPGVWGEIKEHKQARLKKFETLLEEGIKLGFFRSDIPQEVIVRMHTAAVEALTTPQALGELPCTSQEVFRNIVTVMFEGILCDGKRKSFTRKHAKTLAQ